MSEWREFPKEKPKDDEPVLIAALTTQQTSIIQFAKYHTCGKCGGEWYLYEPLGEAVITHFMSIPPLPTIHHVKDKQLN